MKNAAIITSLTVMLFVATGCEKIMGDFLDKAPGVDVNEDVIFSSKVNAETFLASVYDYGIHTNLAYGTDGNINTASSAGGPLWGASDEAEQCAAWYEANSWNAANINASNAGTGDQRWGHRWTAVRKVTVLLDRIDDVPDIDAAYAAQLKAEVRVIRALLYFEMLKYYGGVPIIDHRIQLDEDLKIPRATVREMLDFILKDIDESLPDLPLRQLGNLRGRVDKGLAHALKSKLLLYAASPLFNTGTPYLDLGENNGLICLGSENPSLWSDAAAAAKATLDWAASAGCELITDQGVDRNYQYSWEVYDNKEIIFAEKTNGDCGKWTWPWSAIAPPDIYAGNAGQSGITVTLNHVMKYEKRDGTPQTWNMQGGNDLQAKMAELDYRFKQSIVGNLGYWNWEFPRVEIFQGGRHANTCFGGFWVHKHYPSIIDNPTYWTYTPNSTLFQLNEIYLNYAEAMNEAYGPNADGGYGMTAVDAINIIRARSGQPAVSGTDRETFREKIRHERAIELAFDNHRFWDIRRWKSANEDGVMKGGMYGIRVLSIEGSDEFRYEPYVFETRTWADRLYLNPFGTGEINKGYLVQNPGY